MHMMISYALFFPRFTENKSCY